TLPEIAVLQKRRRQQMQTKEVVPLLEDVSTIWALEWAVRLVMLPMRMTRFQVTL
ncbi:hypothetical protein A2U01_0114031, partial [Trifolium medium]|nr:hypothetical protein [Trifolium medium]